jgi:hypothetical protein
MGESGKEARRTGNKERGTSEKPTCNFEFGVYSNTEPNSEYNEDEYDGCFGHVGTPELAGMGKILVKPAELLGRIC